MNSTKIKLVAFDLDGTLLNAKRELSPSTRTTLARAANSGIEIVPCTGRYFNAMPESIKSLPFVHYAITINGADIRDVQLGRSIVQETFQLNRALDLMKFFDTYADSGQLIYDCYMDNSGWISSAFQANVEAFLPGADKPLIALIRDTRTGVPELKSWLTQRNADGHPTHVQKVQCFTPDPAFKVLLMNRLPSEFPDLVISTSSAYNIEVNSQRAQKGIALATLAAHLGLDISQTMAFGDDINDMSLIKAAGVGVAMGNAKPELKAVADKVTLTNDEDGVAVVLEQLLDFSGKISPENSEQ